jgi:branched-chain amino acid transport system permease protein
LAADARTVRDPAAQAQTARDPAAGGGGGAPAGAPDAATPTAEGSSAAGSNDAAASAAAEPGGRLSAAAPAALGLAALLGLPALLEGSPFYLEILALVFLWGAMAGAWNIVSGYAGKFSLGHAAFFGLGAYASSILYARGGVSPWLGIPVGMALSVALAAFIGLVTLRLKGKYMALCTIAFVSLMEILAVHFRDLTGGSEGLMVPYEPGLANLTFANDHEKLVWAYVFAALALGVFLLCRRLERSPLGYRLAALREDEDAAEALGVNTLAVKLTSFGLSAALTSLGGSLYAQYMLWIEPQYVLSMELSTQFALFAIIGGVGSAVGPFLGAGLMFPLLTLSRSAFPGLPPGFNMLVYGLALIVAVLFFPKGLIALGPPLRRLARLIGRTGRARLGRRPAAGETAAGLNAAEGPAGSSHA